VPLTRDYFDGGRGGTNKHNTTGGGTHEHETSGGMRQCKRMFSSLREEGRT